MALVAVAFEIVFAAMPCRADPINLVVNPGFETGDFSGWTVSGTSIQVGVARDRVPIPNAENPFPPNVQNVRSGQFAANALLSGFAEPVERIVLQQTIQVPVRRMLQIGFWIGNDSQSEFGMNLGEVENPHSTQIFVDGFGILPDSFVTVRRGSSPPDFMLIRGAFDTGLRTQIDVAFSITGSGTSRVGASLDDFFVSQATPEPPTLLLFVTGAIGAGMAGWRNSKRNRLGPRRPSLVLLGTIGTCGFP